MDRIFDFLDQIFFNRLNIREKLSVAFFITAGLPLFLFIALYLLPHHQDIFAKPFIGIVTLVILIIFGGSIFLGFFLARKITEPLNTLHDSLKDVSQGIPLAASIRSESKDEIGDLANYVADLLDSLAKKNAELEAQYNKLKKSDRYKSEFLANITHELRTPLTSIIGSTEAVLDNLGSEKMSSQVQERLLINALSSSKNLLQLITDILDMAKYESGKMKIELRDFEVYPLLANILVDMEVLMAKKKVIVETSLEKRISHLYSDEIKFRQVLYNLLTNAVKFSKEHGTIEIQSFLRHAEGKEIYEVAVVDEGIGIDPKDHERIFHAFQQVDGSLSRDYGGTGLGLAISKRYVEMMGGKIWVESSPGRGAKFTFQIPLAPKEKITQ